MFWPPISLEGGPPEFLDLHYKAHPDSDHVAKFHGDLPRELGGSPAKEIKGKHKAPEGLSSSSSSSRFSVYLQIGQQTLHLKDITVSKGCKTV